MRLPYRPCFRRNDGQKQSLRSYQPYTGNAAHCFVTFSRTPAVTTRGYKEADCVALANWICDVLDNPQDGNVIAGVRENVTKQCAAFPVYG